MDPEFEKLLREGYGFRGNHIKILDFLGGKEASAEEIWTGTEVPRGRVYEFLDDLVDWGFLEVIPGKPRKFKLRNPRKALEAAVSRKEREITQIQRKSLEIAKNLEWVEKVEGLRVQMLESSEEYYSKMGEMMRRMASGNCFRAMVKRPLLVLSSARQTAWKRKFYEELMERAEKDLKVEYLFPLDNLMRAIEERENRDAVLNELEELLGKIDLRYIPTEGTSLTLAGNRILLGFIDPVDRQVEEGVYIESEELARTFQEVFERIFSRAEKVDIELIHKMSMM